MVRLSSKRRCRRCSSAFRRSSPMFRPCCRCCPAMSSPPAARRDGRQPHPATVPAPGGRGRDLGRGYRNALEPGGPCGRHHATGLTSRQRCGFVPFPARSVCCGYSRRIPPFPWSFFTPIRRLQADHPANGFARSSNCLQVLSCTAILPPEVARCSPSRSPGISTRVKPGAGGQSRCAARMD